MNDGSVEHAQKVWDSLLDQLREIPPVLKHGLITDSPENAVNAAEFLMMLLSSAFVLLSRSDPYRPEFMPFVNHVFTYSGPNPDATYYYAGITDSTSYRIGGARNTVHWVNFVTGRDFLGFADEPGKSFGSFDLDQFDIDESGHFDILLSREKPEGHSGNWMKLDPGVNYLIVRQFGKFPDEQDARMFIECLNTVTPPKLETSAAKLAKLERMVGFVKNTATVWPKFITSVGERSPVNAFQSVDYKNSGEVRDQFYQECLYQIAPDEALILEIKPPQKCGYWNIQVDHRYFCTIEFCHRQSTLNGSVDRTDTDGLMRLVLAHEDPGVANWVDTGGLQAGHLLLRWQNINELPDTTIRKVKFVEIQQLLPADTRCVTVEERANALRQWSRSRQLRRMW